MKFLVVDDSATMRRIMINALLRIGYTRTVQAGNGQEALDKLDATVDFVISDSILPGMSGLDLVRAIRSIPCGGSIPIMMVTARGADENMELASAAGVSTYIVRPFTPSVLEAKIDSLLVATVA